MKKLSTIFIFLCLSLAGFWIGIRVAAPPTRVVQTARMERCLVAYEEYRKDADQEKLAEKLQEIGLNPRDFQEIIDRFIFYRSRKSSMDQSLMLLNAFRRGYDIGNVTVYSISGFASEPFRLDAEILAVFENKPELIQRAFEG